MEEIEELNIQEDIECKEKLEEPSIINSVLVDAGINPMQLNFDDYSENEGYYV